MRKFSGDQLICKMNENYRNKKYKNAYEIAQKLADNGFSEGVFTCGWILEKGWLDGEPDLEKAWYYYEQLLSRWQLAQGGLGCVRIMLARNEGENSNKAIELCLDSMIGPCKRLANLNLGRVYEELVKPSDYKKARKAYLKALWHGSATANMFYIRSLWRSGNKIKSILIYLPIIILNMFYPLFYGKSTFDGIQEFRNTLKD